MTPTTFALPSTISVKRFQEQFEKNIIYTENCWEWNGRITQYGYGKFSYLGFGGMAHRLSYMIYCGVASKCVLHTCDNRRCVNPDHLFLGTKDDNNKDRAAKGRSCRGESHHSNVLTEDQARYVISWRIGKRRAKFGSVTALASRLNVSVACLKRIWQGRSWKHLPRN